jgi:hypothetical protein
MTNEKQERQRLLVMVKVPDAPGLALPLVTACRHVDVLLLGYYPVVEQTSPAQARDEYGEEADSQLETLADRLRQQELSVETNLVFTPSVADTVNRLVEEKELDAVLHARPLEELTSIMVPFHGKQHPQEVAAFVAALVRESAIEIKLRVLLPPDAEGEEEPAERSLRESAFMDAGLDPADIDTVIIDSDDPVRTISALAAEADVLVLGESDPTLGERIFQQVHERVIPNVGCPVVVVVHQE